ncbi:MAG: 50S ribosomal protein L17 [Planctomycetes bacterium]|nr:50S ribosomal protein L17 [Planctomycetota bacterium]
MHHLRAGRRLNRTSEHRRAMLRNMASSLFEYGTISTTIQKAKEVQRFAEKLITKAKMGTLHARRQVISTLNNRAIYVEENSQNVRKGTVVGKLFSDIAPQFLDRPGGYTRIVKLAKPRMGDNSKVVLLQLVGHEKKEKKGKKTTDKKKKKAKKTE